MNSNVPSNTLGEGAGYDLAACFFPSTQLNTLVKGDEKK